MTVTLNAKPAAPTKTFSVYKSSMQSHKIITPGGKVLHIVDYKHITDNEEDIAFLDAEIKAGFPYLRKLSDVEVKEADPMSGLRAKIAEEERAKILAEVEAGEAKKVADADVKTAGTVTAAQGKNVKTSDVALTPASTAVLSGLSANSNSGANS